MRVFVLDENNKRRNQMVALHPRTSEEEKLGGSVLGIIIIVWLNCITVSCASPFAMQRNNGAEMSDNNGFCAFWGSEKNEKENSSVANKIRIVIWAKAFAADVDATTTPPPTNTNCMQNLPEPKFSRIL